MPGCCTCTPAAWWGGSGMAAQLASANADAGGNVVASVRDPISPCSGPAFVRAQQRSLLCARGAHVSRGVQARLKRGAAPSASLRCGAGRLLEFIGGTGEGNHRAETEGRALLLLSRGSLSLSFDLSTSRFAEAFAAPPGTHSQRQDTNRSPGVTTASASSSLGRFSRSHHAPRRHPSKCTIQHEGEGRARASWTCASSGYAGTSCQWTSGSTQCQCSCSAVVNCSGRRAPARRSLAPLASDHFSVCALARHARFPARATRCARARGDRDPVRPQGE